MTTPDLSGNTRLTELIDWLDSLGYCTESLRPASTDASFRRYFRVESDQQSFIVMDAPSQQNNNESFVDISRRLIHAGLTVPKLINVDLARGFIVMSDMGSSHYLDELDQSNVETLYTDAMSAIVTMQQCIVTEGLPEYSDQVLRMEMNLLPEWYLGKHKSITLSQSQQSVLNTVFDACVGSALEQPRYFVHRDYHSRNLMICGQGNPGILDYQDAVTGPVTYDLVSLLKDCYLHWPEDLVEKLVSDFHQQLKSLGVLNADLSTFSRWFDFMGLQRHIKVLGIFCRLNYRDDKSGYMNDLPLVYHYIKSVCEKYPELSDFLQLLIDTGAENEFA